MDYEIVRLEEKTVAGISARTNNSNPAMTKTIGGLWEKFYGEGIFQAIGGKQNEKSIGLYHHYASDEQGDYDLTIGCEVSGGVKQPDNVGAAKIAAGNYAKFIVRGHVQRAVAAFWGELWQTNLDRRYQSDFEEYQMGGDMDNAEIHIYIGLK